MSLPNNTIRHAGSLEPTGLREGMYATETGDLKKSGCVPPISNREKLVIKHPQAYKWNGISDQEYLVFLKEVVLGEFFKTPG